MSTPATATASTAAPVNRTFDVSGTRPVPFARLVKVELRKMTDTRAGRWMLGIIALATAGVVVLGFVLTRDDVDDRTFLSFFENTNTPQMLLLPVLGILLITQEWGQRTTLTTFALEPSRVKVVAAKTVAALLFGLAAVLLAGVISAVAAVVGGAADPWLDTEWLRLANLTLLQVMAVLQGVGFGLLLLNSAGAIVLFFALPVVVNIVAGFSSWVRENSPWFDIAMAQAPLYGYDPMTGERLAAALSGEQWTQLGVVTVIWIVLPFVIGMARVLRGEMK
ncbi:ABC transporter permease [Nocardioides jishulii]|uniref:ABC transporter permease n=1 Tax=Nocardioides jishulii TaxID=2575440 RepID=A0A4U2YKQ2_9ACTN|nr:ABC transporter permease [Nocardioides jishulii]QCX26861.1 ABC transporter permease [Nocardioides jishulii]TKI61344.1 ABC transporter permease [Nocardioides jishulii]